MTFAEFSHFFDQKWNPWTFPYPWKKVCSIVPGLSVPCPQSYMPPHPASLWSSLLVHKVASPHILQHSGPVCLSTKLHVPTSSSTLVQFACPQSYMPPHPVALWSSLLVHKVTCPHILQHSGPVILPNKVFDHPLITSSLSSCLTRFSIIRLC